MTSTRTGRRSDVRIRWFAGALAVIVIVAYGITLAMSVRTSGQGQPQVIGTVLDDGIALEVGIEFVDAEQGWANILVRPSAHGDLGGPLGQTSVVSTDITIDVLGCNCTTSFPADAALAPIEGRVPLSGIRPLSAWPLDRYRSVLEVNVTSPDGELVPTWVEVSQSQPQGFTTTYASSEGFDNEASGRGGLVSMTVDVARDGDVLLITAVLTFVIGLLAVASVLIAVMALTGMRDLQVADEIAIPAMIFTLIAMRDALPGSPPLGVNYDLLFFYWVLVVMGLSFVILLLPWLVGGRRRGSSGS